MGKMAAISLLALAQALAMSLWFAGSAVLPTWTVEYGLDGWQASLVSSSVSAGFVIGTLASAFLGLADRVDPRRLFFVSALLAGLANVLILTTTPDGLFT
ncbi:MAG: hypothetical protein V3R73_07565, partial [Sphingomonadales bacterium]